MATIIWSLAGDDRWWLSAELAELGSAIGLEFMENGAPKTPLTGELSLSTGWKGLGLGLCFLPFPHPDLLTPSMTYDHSFCDWPHLHALHSVHSLRTTVSLLYTV